MAVKIKLKRLGKIREPHYRIIVTDAHTKRDGRAIEEVGKYSPKEQPSFIEVKSDRVQHWLSVGAQPTEPVRAILEKTGDWQQFRGLKQPKPLETREEKPDKKAVFEAAAKEAQESGEQAEGQRGKAKRTQQKKTSAASQKTSGGERNVAADSAGTQDPAGPASDREASPETREESAGNEG